MTTLDPRDHVYKPPRVAGEVPVDYQGPVFYRISNIATPSTGFGFKGWSKAEKLLWERLPGIGNLGPVGLEPGRVVDEHGKLLAEFAEPIQAKVDTRRKAPDWELRDYPPLVSNRVKEIIEEFEPGKAVFIPIDAAWPDGRIDRYYWAVWGKLWGQATDDVTAPQWFHTGGQGFHFLSAPKVEGRHFIWGVSYTGSRCSSLAVSPRNRSKTDRPDKITRAASSRKWVEGVADRRRGDRNSLFGDVKLSVCFHPLRTLGVFLDASFVASSRHVR